MIELNGWKRIKHARLILACLILCTASSLAQTENATKIRPTARETFAEQHGGYIKNQGNSKVIVFVHGLFSDPEAWRCDPNHYWPEMIANDESSVFADTDVYVAKYPTPPRGGEMTLADIASNLYNRLTADNVFSGHQQVIFVAHSMGGILVQQLLITYTKEKLSEKVPAIFLYGTPDEGSRIANLAHYFNRDPLLKELQSGEGNFVLPDMDQKWHHSEASQIKRYCAYETRPEDGFKIVNRNSATRGCDDSVAVDSDHHHLVKPCSTEDTAYTFLKNRLRELAVTTTADPPTYGVSRPSSHPTQEQAPTLTPFKEVESISQAVRNLDNDWNGATLRAQQELAEPYKFGPLQGQPFPKTFPPQTIDGLNAAYWQLANRYIAIQPKLYEARTDANECMKLTPNQEETDKKLFHVADAIATTPVPISRLESPSQQNGSPFMLMDTYLSNLENKIGDTRCGMH